MRRRESVEGVESAVPVCGDGVLLGSETVGNGNENGIGSGNGNGSENENGNGNWFGTEIRTGIGESRIPTLGNRSGSATSEALGNVALMMGAGCSLPQYLGALV